MLVLSKQQISWDICLICIYLMRIFAKAFLTHIHTDGFTLHLIKSSPGKLLFLCIYIYICMLSLGLFNLAVNLNCLLLYFSDSVIRAHITRFVCKWRRHCKVVKQWAIVTIYKYHRKEREKKMLFSSILFLWIGWHRLCACRSQKNERMMENWRILLAQQSALYIFIGLSSGSIDLNRCSFIVRLIHYVPLFLLLALLLLWLAIDTNIHDVLRLVTITFRKVSKENDSDCANGMVVR